MAEWSQPRFENESVLNWLGTAHKNSRFRSDQIIETLEFLVSAGARLDGSKYALRFYDRNGGSLCERAVIRYLLKAGAFHFDEKAWLYNDTVAREIYLYQVDAILKVHQCRSMTTSAFAKIPGPVFRHIVSHYIK